MRFMSDEEMLAVMENDCITADQVLQWHRRMLGIVLTWSFPADGEDCVLFLVGTGGPADAIPVCQKSRGRIERASLFMVDRVGQATLDEELIWVCFDNAEPEEVSYRLSEVGAAALERLQSEIRSAHERVERNHADAQKDRARLQGL